MRTICASSVSLPTRSACMTNVPVPFTVPPVTFAPATFSTGIGSPVTIDSSTVVAPSSTTPSTGHPLAGAHAQSIANSDALERNVLLCTRRDQCGGPSSAPGRADS